MSDQKPTMIGFKPSDDDFQMLKDLHSYYQSMFNDTGFDNKITISDILKIAIRELYKSAFNVRDEK